MSEMYTTFELEAMTDEQLAEAYENTFAECYPCQPSAYPDFFLYAGIDEDPDFRPKAIKAIASGEPLPRVSNETEYGPNVLF